MNAGHDTPGASTAPQVAIPPVESVTQTERPAVAEPVVARAVELDRPAPIVVETIAAPRPESGPADFVVRPAPALTPEHAPARQESDASVSQER